MTDIGRRGKGGSKRGTKGGSSRPGLQESLEELTRLADDLVDSLSDEGTVDQAPAEQTTAEEIFLDLDDNSEEAANVAIEEPAAEAPEEFEVVEPSEQSPVAAASKSEVSAVDDGAALQETLEELDLIGQQESPVVQRFEVEFAGDKGADIDAHLDTLFGGEPSEQPSEPAPEPPTVVAVESAELSFEDYRNPRRRSSMRSKILRSRPPTRRTSTSRSRAKNPPSRRPWYPTKPRARRSGWPSRQLSAFLRPWGPGCSSPARRVTTLRLHRRRRSKRRSSYPSRSQRHPWNRWCQRFNRLRPS